MSLKLQHYVVDVAYVNVLAMAWRVRWGVVLATPAQSSRHVFSITYRGNGLILHT
jgi:hypothetical protein